MRPSKIASNISLPDIESYFKVTKKDSINLTIGEPDFELSKDVENKIFSASKHFLKYSSPEGNPELRKQIARNINNSHGTSYTLNNVLITTGSSYSLLLVLQSIINQGEEVIIFEPYFPPYIELVKIVGAHPKVINTSQDFTPVLSDIKKALTKKTKAVILNSPNNPTGKIYPANLLASIADLAKKYGLVIISDEVYKDFDYNDKFSSPAKFCAETIIVNSFSKSHSATGLRIGYICAPSNIIKVATRILFLEQVCVAEFIQEGFIGNIKEPEKERKKYKENRNIVVRELSKNFKNINIDGGFYFFLKAPCDERRFLDKLSENGVMAMPGSIFSSKSNYFRISLISDPKKLLKATNIINKTYEELR